MASANLYTSVEIVASIIAPLMPQIGTTIPAIVDTGPSSLERPTRVTAHSTRILTTTVMAEAALYSNTILVGPALLVGEHAMMEGERES